ncbi:S41 family peptidase [Zhouia spongiae]|uniref:S41 family peptidase n=1 Tax=Zhouia spongiae TaxID=2202721 RepID=A0ABY3YQX3_9FLAO|nr:S41 family peptidase [Zhouia spongiae]UNZ00236.1 S41 family peptidase [Zhouia spongiae]
MVTKKILISLTLLLVSTLGFGQYLTKEKAQEDLIEFKTLLKNQSSYYQVSNFDFEKSYNEVERKINQEDSIPIYFLAFELEKIISNIIDRHANIRMENFEDDDYELLNLYLPFAVTSLGNNIVALRYNKTTKEYEYFNQAYPYIKEVDGIYIKDFLNNNAYTRKLSPNRAKQTDELKDLRDIGELYFKQGKTALENIEITLTNGTTDKKLNLPLSNRRNWYYDIGSTFFNRDYSKFGRDKDFKLSKLDKWLTDSIAYLAIPAMSSYEENLNLESYLKSTIEKYRESKAMIIDIRGNGGGTREILNTLSGYFIQPEQSPWVANVAYVRSDQFLDEDISSMQSRFLFNYNSEMLSDEDRKAIDIFNRDYETEFKVDKNKFSEPYYMVLHSKQPIKYPVYILVNEECFSAASVFTSAFKGLDNVKIVGVTTNGSSGRSQKFYLKNSNIRVKLSTMLSFQRNGKTLDGNGTVPDIIIERDENQVLRKGDSQLKKLIEIIKNQAQ